MPEIERAATGREASPQEKRAYLNQSILDILGIAVLAYVAYRYVS